MVVTVFEQLKLNPQKSGKCTICGKNRRRQTVIYETINPWNRNKDGSVKSPDEVWTSVRAKVEEWMDDPLVCFTCERDKK